MKSLHHIFNTSKGGWPAPKQLSLGFQHPGPSQSSACVGKGAETPLWKAAASPSPSARLEFGHPRAPCRAGLVWELQLWLGFEGPFPSWDSETAISHKRNWFPKVSLAWKAAGAPGRGELPEPFPLWALLNNNFPDFSFPRPTGKALSHTPTLQLQVLLEVLQAPRGG